MAGMQKRTLYIIGAAALVVLLAAAIVLWPKGEAKARVTAAEFVAQLKNVSLTAGSEAIASAIDEHYAPYVTDELVERWKADTDSAPGREASSPWPDRIFIKNVSKQGEGYVINADVLYMSSVEEATPEEDAAGVTVVVMQVIPTDDGWRIAAYEELFSEVPDAASTTEETDLRG